MFIFVQILARDKPPGQTGVSGAPLRILPAIPIFFQTPLAAGLTVCTVDGRGSFIISEFLFPDRETISRFGPIFRNSSRKLITHEEHRAYINKK